MRKYLKLISGNNVAGLRIPTDIIVLVDVFNYYISLNKVEGNGLEKILLLFSHENNEPRHRVQGTILYVYVHVSSDLEKVLTSENTLAVKRKLFFEIFSQNIRDVALEYNLNLQSLELSLNKISDKEFIFSDKWGGVKSSPNRSKRATILWTLESKLELFAIVIDSNGINKKILFANYAPTIAALQENIEGLLWRNENELICYKKGRSKYWIIETEKGKVDFVSEKAERGDGHAQYILGMQYLEGQEVVRNVDIGMQWMLKSSQAGFPKAKNWMDSQPKN